jgi:hypothetical protein
VRLTIATAALLLSGLPCMAVTPVDGQCNATLPAENDCEATFESGMFLLPELANSKDSYLLILKPKAGGDATKISLPQGSTGLRVGKATLPDGQWTWLYKVRQAEPPLLEATTPTELKLRANDVLGGRMAIGWMPIPGAARYTVSGEAQVVSGSQPAPRWEKFEASCLTRHCVTPSGGGKDIALSPGSEVRWKVTAYDADEVVIARSREGHIQVGNTWSDDMAKDGWKLQRSETLSKLTATQAASFSYVSSQKDAPDRATAYQSEFALIYNGPKEWQGFALRGSLEAKLTSSGEQKANDALKLRIGGYRMFGTLGRGAELGAGFKYETQRKTGTKKGLVEVGFTPNYGVLGGSWPGPATASQADAAGNYTRASLPAVQLMPVLALGIELGKTMEVGKSEEVSETILRIRTSTRLDVNLNFLARELGIPMATASIEGTFWRLPKEEKRNYLLGRAGLSLSLTDMVSLEFAYAVGKEAPAFTFSRSGTAGLGLKF